MTWDTVPSLPFSSAPPRPAQAALTGAALALAGPKSRLWVPRVAGGARSAQTSTVAPGKAALTLPEPGVWCEMMAENRYRPQLPHWHWHQHRHQHRALCRGATQPISQLLELKGSVSLVQLSRTSTDTHSHTRQTRWCPPGLPALVFLPGWCCRSPGTRPELSPGARGESLLLCPSPFLLLCWQHHRGGNTGWH